MPLTAILIKRQNDKEFSHTLSDNLNYGETYPFLLMKAMEFCEEIDQSNIRLDCSQGEHTYFTNEAEQLWLHNLQQQNDFYRLFVVSRKIKHKFIRTPYYLLLQKQ